MNIYHDPYLLKVSSRTLAKELKLPNSRIGFLLSLLEKRGLLKIERVRGRTYYIRLLNISLTEAQEVQYPQNIDGSSLL